MPSSRTRSILGGGDLERGDQAGVGVVVRWHEAQRLGHVVVLQEQDPVGDVEGAGGDDGGPTRREPDDVIGDRGAGDRAGVEVGGGRHSGAERGGDDVPDAAGGDPWSFMPGSFPGGEVFPCRGPRPRSGHPAARGSGTPGPARRGLPRSIASSVRSATRGSAGRDLFVQARPDTSSSDRRDSSTRTGVLARRSRAGTGSPA